jgi:Flp pilus assembly protein TadB
MLIIFISAIFIAMTCILYLIFSRPRRPQQVATTMSLMEWAKEASKHLEDSQLDRPIWLLGIYAGCGVVGLIFGFAYFHTVPAGILCGLLAFFIPEQFVNQRLLARNNKLIEQLGMAVRLFSSEYRDTPHPVRALDITSKKVPNPLGKVLRDTVRDFNSGKPIDDTLLKLSKKLHTPYGKLFAQLLRQSFEDETVVHLFIKLSARLSSHQDLVQENNKQTKSNRMLISIMNVALIPAFLIVNKVFPESHAFFTQEVTGRLIIIFALSSAVGAVLVDRILNGGDQFD